MLPTLHYQETNAANFNSLNTNKKFNGIKFWLVILSSLVGVMSQGQQAQPGITVTAVSPNPVCAGSTVTITFTTKNGVGINNHFTTSTSYTVLLSNASGTGFTPLGAAFTTPGITYTTVTSGITHTVTIPAATSAGTNYKISLSSTSPTFNGSAGVGASPAFTVNNVHPSIDIADAPGVSKANVSACGTNDGFVAIRISPRTGTTTTAPKPFVFTLDGVVTSPTSEPGAPFKFNNLGEGLHTISMTAGACASNTLSGRIGKDFFVNTEVGTVVNQSCAKGGYLTAFGVGGNGFYRYSITKEGGKPSTPATGHLFTDLVAGTYIVTVSDNRGCADPTPVTTTILGPAFPCPPPSIAASTSANVIAKNSLSLLALPNPTRTAFTLNLQSGSKERVQIIVTDLSGKKLYQTTGNSNRQYTFGGEFASGMYIVQVIQGKDIKTLKLIKEN